MLRIYSIFIAIFAVLVTIYYDSQRRRASSQATGTMSDATWCFEAQRGFFSHDNDPESWEFRAVTQPSLGLLDRSYPTDKEYWVGQGKAPDNLDQTQWHRFQYYIKSLNAINPEKERYKLFYIVRHGQGVHNVKEAEVGREEWNVCPSSTT